MAWPLRSNTAGIYQEPADAICLPVHDGEPGVFPQKYSLLKTNMFKTQADTGFLLFKQFLQVTLKKSFKRLTSASTNTENIYFI